MVDLAVIRGYIDPKDIVIEEKDVDFYTNVLDGTVDFIEYKCNIEIDNSSSPSILLLVSKLFKYNLVNRPHLKDMRTDDMRLIFSTNYPESLMRDLLVHRKVSW